MTARIELHAHRTDIHTRAKERHLETHRGSENTPSTHSNKKKKIKRGSTQRKKESDEVYTEQWSATKIAKLSGKSRMFSILWMWV